MAGGRGLDTDLISQWFAGIQQPRSMFPLIENFVVSGGQSYENQPKQNERLRAYRMAFSFSYTSAPNPTMALEFRFVVSNSFSHCEVDTLLLNKLSKSLQIIFLNVCVFIAKQYQKGVDSFQKKKTIQTFNKIHLCIK